MKLNSNLSFFQSTIARCRDHIFDERSIVVAANDHRFLVAENVSELGCAADILLEPVARNSCAAIVCGCLQALQRDPDAIVLVLAADHLVDDITAFEQTVRNAIPAAKSGALVTFGVKPTHASTGYGYLNVDLDLFLDHPSCHKVNKFVEKPDHEKANEYLDQGYFWNSGNFMFSASSFLEEVKNIVPEVYSSVNEAFEKSVRDLDFIRLNEAAFSCAPSISVDYAIMEKTKKAVMVPALHDWSDIGTWNSVWDNLPKDKDDNVSIGEVVVLEGERNLVHSPGKLTTLLGVDDLAVVATSDVVLVADRRDSEKVKDLVSALTEAGHVEATSSHREYRPWGNYDVLDLGERYKVKRIEIKPQGVLSLQRHMHRAEHWVLVSGELEVTLSDSVNVLKPNQSVYIDRKVVHRLANRGQEVAVLIEVQTGDYLGEDDIERLDDQYNRVRES